MFCSNCGTQIPDGAMFCPGCGSSTGAPVQPAPVPAQPVQQVAQSAPAPQPVQQVAQSAPAPQPVQQVVQPTPAPQPVPVQPVQPAPVPQPAPVKSKKKKGKTGLIIAIISLLVIAGGVLAFLFLYLFPKKNVELLCKNAWYMVEGIDYNDSDYTGKMMGQYGLEFKEKGTAILHEVYDEETEYDWEISGNTLKCDYFNDDVEILNITDEEFVVKSGDDEIIFVTKKILKKEYKDLYDKYMTMKAKEETWYSTSDTPPAIDNGALPTAAKDNRTGLIKIGIINSDPNESGYRVAQDKDFKTFFTKDNGFDACFAYSMKNDEQIAAAQKLVQDRVDYLLICPANSDGWDNVLKEAQNAGTKVIIYDREVNADPSLYYTSITSNFRTEGEDAVEWLRKQNLDHYSIIHLQGYLGTDAQIGRSEALEEAVANYGDWEYVRKESANWSADEAYMIIYDVLDNEGYIPNVIYAENDDMARGAAQALDEMGYAHGTNGDIIIISFDCNRWALEELLNGRWNYNGQCSPFYASTIIDVINSSENGVPMDKKLYIKELHFTSDTITEEDVKKYGI